MGTAARQAALSGLARGRTCPGPDAICVYAVPQGAGLRRLRHPRSLLEVFSNFGDSNSVIAIILTFAR